MSIGLVDALLQNLLLDISENIHGSDAANYRFYPEQSRYWRAMKASFIADYSYPYNNLIQLEEIVAPLTALLTNSYPDYNIEYNGSATSAFVFFVFSKK